MDLHDGGGRLAGQGIGDLVVEGHRFHIAAATLSEARAGRVDDHAAHHMARVCQEGRLLRAAHAASAGEAQKGFVDQRRGIQQRESFMTAQARAPWTAVVHTEIGIVGRGRPAIVMAPAQARLPAKGSRHSLSAFFHHGGEIPGKHDNELSLIKKLSFLILPNVAALKGIFQLKSCGADKARANLSFFHPERRGA